MAIFIMLLGIITLNLNTAKQKASIETTVDVLLTDLSQQQLKAMVGDTEGRGTHADYGIHMDTTSYTYFHDSYSVAESTNFVINLPDNFEVTTTFPSNQVIFEKGSGEISCFVNETCADGTNIITVTDTTNNQQKTIELNRYGIVTEVQ